MNLISLSKVAEKCDVSTRTVRKWIADGDFPQHTTELPGGHKRWVEMLVPESSRRFTTHETVMDVDELA